MNTFIIQSPNQIYINNTHVLLYNDPNIVNVVAVHLVALPEGFGKARVVLDFMAKGKEEKVGGEYYCGRAIS